MTTTDPARLARVLAEVAIKLRCDGNTTERTVAEWGAIGSGGSGPGQKGSHSDPTGTEVAATLDHDTGDSRHLNRRPTDPPCPICVALLPQRWRTATHTMRTVGAAVQLPGALSLPLASLVMLLAQRANGAPRTIDGRSRARLLHAAKELEHVMAEAQPVSREVAAEIVAAEERRRAGARRCKACDSPEVDLKAGLGVDCYNLRAQWIARGRVDMADDEAFVAAVQRDVRLGLLGREASPLWRLDAPKYVHEDELSQEAS